MYKFKFKGFTPDYEQDYFMFDETGTVVERTNYGDIIDLMNIALGNCFDTVEDAMQWEDDVLKALNLTEWK